MLDTLAIRPDARNGEDFALAARFPGGVGRLMGKEDQ
jgi:hypothetical protein